MHQPIDTECHAQPQPQSATATEPQPATAAVPQPVQPPRSKFDIALAELQDWVSAHETRQEQARQQQACERPPIDEPQPEPSRIRIRIPDDVPSFESW